MRILIFHGYLLRGTGSNIYNAKLARTLARLGHEVDLFCQDRTVHEPEGVTTHVPDIGPVLPVYVAERYEGFDALPFPELDEATLGRYLDAIADLECESRSPSSRDDGAHFRRAARRNAIKQAYCPKRFYRQRHKIENFFCRIKDWRPQFLPAVACRRASRPRQRAAVSPRAESTREGIRSRPGQIHTLVRQDVRRLPDVQCPRRRHALSQPRPD
jgi:hypothetical protein